MITYMFIKDDDFDFEDILSYMLLPLCIIFDLVCIIFQPIFYLIYKYKRVMNK